MNKSNRTERLSVFLIRLLTVPVIIVFGFAIFTALRDDLTLSDASWAGILAFFIWALLPAAPIVTSRSLTIPIMAGVVRKERIDTYSYISALPIAIYIAGVYDTPWYIPVLIGGMAFLIRALATGFKTHWNASLSHQVFMLITWSTIFVTVGALGYVIPASSGILMAVGAIIASVLGGFLRWMGTDTWQAYTTANEKRTFRSRLDTRAMAIYALLGFTMGIVIAIEWANEVVDLWIVLGIWLVIVGLFNALRIRQKPKLMQSVIDTGDAFAQMVRRKELDAGIARRSLLLTAGRVVGITSPARLVIIGSVADQREFALFGADSRNARAYEDPGLLFPELKNHLKDPKVSRENVEEVSIVIMDDWLSPRMMHASDRATLSFVLRAAFAEIDKALLEVQRDEASVPDLDLDTGLATPEGVRQAFQTITSSLVAEDNTNSSVAMLVVRLIDPTGVAIEGIEGVEALTRATRSLARSLISMDETSPFKIQCAVMGPGRVCLLLSGVSDHVHPLSLAFAISNRLKETPQALITESEIRGLTATVGVSVFPRQGRSFDSLFMAADRQAMNQPMINSDPWTETMIRIDDALTQGDKSPIQIHGWMLSRYSGSGATLAAILYSFKEAGDDLSRLILVPSGPIDSVDEAVVDSLLSWGVSFGLPIGGQVDANPLESIAEYLVTPLSVAESGAWGEVLATAQASGLKPIVFR